MNGMTAQELAAAVRADPETLAAILRDERRLGRVELRNGRYAITPQGLQEIGMPLLGVRRPREMT